MKRARINTVAKRPVALLLPIVAVLLVTGVIGAGWIGARAAQPQASQALPEQAFTPTIDPFFLTLTPGFVSPLATPTMGPPPTSTPTIDPTAFEVRSATVNAASGANLRSAANVNANVVSVLQNGAVYVVSQGPLTGGDAAQWVELALPGGGRGWIMANLVTIDARRLPYAEAAALLASVGMVVPQPGALPATPTLAPGLAPPAQPGLDPLATPDPFALPTAIMPVTVPVTLPVEAPVTAPITAPVALTTTVTITPAVLPLTIEQLRAAAWLVPSINVTGTIQFVEGAFANQETGLRVVLTDTLVAVGDITGDGADDAAVILQVTQPDGTVTYDLVVAVNQGAVPVAVAGTQLGAPLVIEELRIEKGAVWLTMRIVGPGDDPCCPTLPLKRIYVLRGDELVELPAASYGRIFPYRYGTLYGYVNVLGEFVVPPQFQFAGDFSEGLALVSRDGKRFGFINSLGQVVIPLEYTFATPFSGGLTVAGLPPADETAGAAPGVVAGDDPGISQGDGQGDQAGSEQVVYLDRSGRNVFGATTFAAGQPFSDGLAAVKAEGGKFGYINMAGEVVVPAAFDFALAFSEGLAPVLQDDRVGYINRSGALVIPVQFDAGGIFSEGLAAVAISGTVGYIDHTGEFVVEPTLERGTPFVEGLAAVAVGGAEAYINSNGTTVIDAPAFTNAQEFSEGLAAVRVDELFGYVSPQGDLAIEPQFAVANPFRQGFATVETDDSWGVIAHDGTWLVQLSLLPLQPVTATTFNTITVALEAPAGPATDIVSFVPAVPDEIRAGACYGGSDIVSVSTAWRCGLIGGEVFDPCIIAADAETIVCGADPATGEAGFVLELTQPLPTDAIEAKEYPGAWLFELTSGAVCRFTQGTTVTIEGERVNYACSDRTQLLGEINKQGALWTIDAVTTSGNTETGPRILTRTPLMVARAWLPGLVETTQTGN